jgi:hypothetical protein
MNHIIELITVQTRGGSHPKWLGGNGYVKAPREDYTKALEKDLYGALVLVPAGDHSEQI